MSSSMAVGAVTIGQAPRPDICGDLRSILGHGVPLLEAGALDGLGSDQIAALAPEDGEFPLITRLGDGSTVVVAKPRIIPLLQQRLDELAERGARLFVILCTGAFPAFRAQGPVLLPQRVLAKAVEALGVRRVGVLPPLEGQVEEVRARWTDAGFEPTVIPASPYEQDGVIIQAAEGLRNARVELAVLDCQGYRLRHRDVVRQVLDCPVLSPSGVMGRLIQELVA
jgi:protein AroM